MEDLIRQAFLHVEVLGPHVSEGHYDLVGPAGDIILPRAWEAVIEPDWVVTMHMWPMPEPEQPPIAEEKEDEATQASGTYVPDLNHESTSAPERPLRFESSRNGKPNGLRYWFMKQKNRDTFKKNWD